MPDAATLPGPPHHAGNGIERDQRAVIDFLADPATHGGVERIERFETHGNLVFLAGTEAFKIKRAVRFDYMDFSTLEKRRVACFREVGVNQRCGGDLYLGCVSIRRSSSGHSILQRRWRDRRVGRQDAAVRSSGPVEQTG